MTVWTREQIIDLLHTNDKAVGRALLVLNKRQTTDERQDETTKYRNDRGFRPCHAKKGTSMAEDFSRKGFLTAKQVAWWRVRGTDGKSRIQIYSRQLLEEVK